MWHKFIIFSLFLSLSSCGVKEVKKAVSKGLNDEKDEETIECKEARKNRAAMDTLDIGIEVMKKYAYNYEFKEISDYCKYTLSYRANSDRAKPGSELAELSGEAYNQMETLCDKITALFIAAADKKFEITRKTNPTAFVIAFKDLLLKDLDQAKKTANDSILKVEDNIRESCS